MKDLNLRRSERSFLADQAADAKTAMAGALHDIKDTLTRIADVRSRSKQHPWLAVGSVVAAGLVTGAVWRLAQRKTINSTTASVEVKPPPGCHAQKPTQAKKSLLFSIVATVVAGISQTVVKSFIAALSSTVTLSEAKRSEESPVGSVDPSVAETPSG